MNENELFIVKEYKFDNQLITKKDSIKDNCYRDCHNKFFHTNKYDCIYDNKLTNITNNEIINLTISDKSMSLYELNKKSKVARQNGLIFNQIIELKIKIFSPLRYIHISYYRKFPMPTCHRQLFRAISQNQVYVENFCNDMETSFHSTCRKWYLYNNPQC